MNLVVGSSGLLGGMIARRLLERGEPVRVMVPPTDDNGGHRNGRRRLEGSRIARCRLPQHQDGDHDGEFSAARRRRRQQRHDGRPERQSCADRRRQESWCPPVRVRVGFER